MSLTVRNLSEQDAQPQALKLPVASLEGQEGVSTLSLRVCVSISILDPEGIPCATSLGSSLITSLLQDVQAYWVALYS